MVREAGNAPIARPKPKGPKSTNPYGDLPYHAKQAIQSIIATLPAGSGGKGVSSDDLTKIAATLVVALTGGVIGSSSAGAALLSGGVALTPQEIAIAATALGLTGAGAVSLEVIGQKILDSRMTADERDLAAAIKANQMNVTIDGVTFSVPVIAGNTPPPRKVNDAVVASATGGTPARAPWHELNDPTPMPTTGAGSGPSTGTPTTTSSGSTSSGSPSGDVSGGSGLGGSAGLAGEAADGAVQVPGGYQLWRANGQEVMLAYRVPGEDYWLTYTVPDPATLQALFPSGIPAWIEVNASGIPGVLVDPDGVERATFVGDTRGVVALENTSEDPFINMENIWANRASRNKAYSDPGFLAKLTESILEGRTLTIDDLYDVDSIALFPDGSPRSEAQVSRLLNVWTMTDNEYGQAIEVNRETVRGQMEAAGIALDENAEAVVNYIANQAFTMEWSAEYATLQMSVLSGASTADMDEGLLEVTQGITLDTLPNQIASLRRDAERVLGPAVSGLISDSFFRNWAQDISRSPNQLAGFQEALQGMFLANFSAYGNNPSLTYEDIAPTYRGLVQNTWGEAPDESDPFFMSLIQGNDMEAASKALRRKGVDTGKEKVVNSVLSSVGQAFGSGVVNSRNF